MRWSIIRTIWLREMRDQMRDRRTIFMILALPLLLYPVLGGVAMQFLRAFAENPSIVGVMAESKTSPTFRAVSRRTEAAVRCR